MLNAAGYYTEPTPQNVAVSLLQDQVDTTDVNNPALYLTQNLTGVYTDPDPRTYPLSSYGYLILPTTVQGQFTAAKGTTLAAFSYYAMCQGQQESAALGYSPMPINLVQASFAQIAKIPGPRAEHQHPELQQPDVHALGLNLLAQTAPYPPACDKQGPTQCTTGTGGAAAVSTPVDRRGRRPARRDRPSGAGGDRARPAPRERGHGPAASRLGVGGECATRPPGPHARALQASGRAPATPLAGRPTALTLDRWLPGRVVDDPDADRVDRPGCPGADPRSRAWCPGARATDGADEPGTATRHVRRGTVAPDPAVAAPRRRRRGRHRPGRRPDAVPGHPAGGRRRRRHPIAGTAGAGHRRCRPTASAVTVSGHGAVRRAAGHGQPDGEPGQPGRLGLVDRGDPTTDRPRNVPVHRNYLQIFECWGDPQTTRPGDAADPGPLPTPVRVRRGGSTPTRRTRSPGDRASSTRGCCPSRGGAPSRSCNSGHDVPAACSALGYYDTVDGLPGRALRRRGRHRRRSAGQLQLRPQPARPEAVLAQPLLQLRHHQRGRLRPHLRRRRPGSQLFQVDTGLEAPGPRVRPAAAAGSRRRHQGARSAGWWWCPGAPRPRRTRPTSTSDSVVTSPLTPDGVGQPDRHPAVVQPGRARAARSTPPPQQIDGQRAGRRRPCRAGSRRCAPSRASPSYSYIESTDDLARQNLADPDLRLGWACRCSPIRSHPARPVRRTPSSTRPLTLSGVVVAFNIQRVPARRTAACNRTSWPLAGTQVAEPLPDAAADGQAADPVVPVPVAGRHGHQPGRLQLGPTQPRRPLHRPGLPAVQPRVQGPVDVPGHRRRHRPGRGGRAPTRPPRCGSGSWPTPRPRRGSNGTAGQRA